MRKGLRKLHAIHKVLLSERLASLLMTALILLFAEQLDSESRPTVSGPVYLGVV